MNQSVAMTMQSRANAMLKTRHVFVKDLKVMTRVGVLDHEKIAPQRLVISVDLTVREADSNHNDQLDNVVCYGEVVKRIKEICSGEHVNLIETIAEHVAESCLEDKRVLAARIRIDKPDIIPECASVGIEIERLQAPA